MRGRGRVGDFEKTFLQALVVRKKFACSTNVIESLREKKGKNILPTRLLARKKKFFMTRNHPSLPSRVKPRTTTT